MSAIERAEFWVRVLTLLSTLAPLVVVLIFGRSTWANEGDAIGELIRHTISLSLISILIAIAALARAVWKRIPKPDVEATPARSA